ncbi:MAG: aldehyde ferredoxin oxidoreductase family protein [Oscillospiraceae bacterium]|nr:aldehyde ferredoxin oxidoreductase family protein [Oscillospiraceae bacterium]
MFPDAKILDIDLSKGKVDVMTIPGETYRLYPGGSALGVYLLLNKMPAGVDPLSPANVLAMTSSPIAGLPVSGGSRLNITAKSPLTGGVGDSQSGGYFGAHLKANGWDGIAITGKSDKPVYLYIDGDKAELKDASAIWGKVTGEAEEIIKKEIGEDKLQVVQIGPAGEKMVKFAAIINDCSRANGRTGMGAVMGSKQLKAVVVKETKSAPAVNKDKLMELSKRIAAGVKENPTVAGLQENGTAGELGGNHEAGFLITRNWQTGQFPGGWEKITGQTMTETVLKKNDSCFACAVRCKRVVEIDGKVDPRYGGPEYETCATFGSYCGVDDLEAVCVCNQICNMYGMDTISCGATISFAMECVENGLLKDDGLGLKFGNAEAMIKACEMIAKREGALGDLLAEGSARAAAKIGGNAKDYSISVKGQEIPAHMPHFKPALGVIYAVNPFGADHQSSDHDPMLSEAPDTDARKWYAQIGLWKGYEDHFEMDAEKARFALETQKYFSVADTLGLCQFVWVSGWALTGPDDIVDLCKYGIGWETSIYELMLVGERRINMMRFFNQREGFTKADDVLPERIFQKIPDGPGKGQGLTKESFEYVRGLYYENAGWDSETGNPTDGTLSRLSLDWLKKL